MADYTWEQLMENAPRLPNSMLSETIMDVLDQELSQPAKDAMVLQLTPRIQATIDAERVEATAGIYSLVLLLDVADPLRIAIEGV